MKKRIITAAILILVCVPCILWNKISADILLMVFLTCSAFEIGRIYHKKLGKVFPLIFSILILVLCLLFLYTKENIVYSYFVLMVMAVACIPIFSRKIKLDDCAVTALFTTVVLFTLRGYNAVYGVNKYLFFFVILISCLVDAGAYFTGSFWPKEKHKLDERISPNKSIEGSVGGIIIAFIIGFILLPHIVKTDILFRVLYVLMLTITGQIGDLFFSMIKRHYGIKDFGDALAGHGGFLDRIDSIIFNLISSGILILLLL